MLTPIILIEMDSRESDGISVVLGTDTTGHGAWIHLTDARTDLDVTFPVPPDSALDAFRHPFAYAEAV